MGNSKLFGIIAVFLFVLSADIALAATLHGKIYDLDLNELNDVVVIVDSEPVQRYVSKDGGYSFELNPGKYTLNATYSSDDAHVYSVTEEVTIDKEGDYVYDLFLFPDFEEDDEILDDEIVELPENGEVQEKTISTTLIVVVIAAIIVLIVAYFVIGRVKKKKQKEEIKEADRLAKKDHQQRTAVKKHDRAGEVEDSDLKQMIDLIKKDGGRTTQKELRKQIPLSEAKISLMISELEHKGIVQKVKKGRGNILILKKS